MPSLSDTLPELLAEIQNLINSEGGGDHDNTLAGQYQDLSLQLAALVDVTPDSDDPAYQNALMQVLNATKQLRDAKTNADNVATAIANIAAVISALAKIAGMAA